MKKPAKKAKLNAKKLEKKTTLTRGNFGSIN